MGRYFVKKDDIGKVLAFGRGGTEGEEITQEEFEQLRAEHIAAIQKDIAAIQDPEPMEERITIEDRLAALEAAVLEIAIGGLK